MPSVRPVSSRLFREKKKAKTLVAVFEIQGHYDKKDLDVVVARGGRYKLEKKSVIEYTISSGIEYTLLKVSLKETVNILESGDEEPTLGNDYTFTIKIDDSRVDVPVNNVPVDDFDPCNFD